MQGKNPLHHQYMGRIYGGSLVYSRVFFKRVNGDLGAFSVISISLGGRVSEGLGRMMRLTQL